MASLQCAAANRLVLGPNNSEIAYTVEALGILPIRGVFQRFAGTTVLDPAHPGACHVDVTVQVASLRMDDPARQREALEPDMLDAARFPTMHFNGSCATPGITGRLTMHGVSRPLSLALHQNHGRIIATAALRRQDFGINGLPTLVGSRVTLSLSTPAAPKG